MKTSKHEPYLLLRLWSVIAPPRRSQLLALLAFTLFASVAEVFSLATVIPFLGVLTAPEKIFSSAYAQPLISLLRPTQPKDLLGPITLIFCGATLFAAVVRMINIWLRTHLTFAVGADLSNEIYRRTLYQPYSIHLSRNSSVVIDGISIKVNNVIFGVLTPLLLIASNSLMLVSILAAILFYQPIIALLSFTGFGLIYGTIFQFTRARLRSNSRQIATNSTTLIKTLQEGLGGIRDVLLDRTQEVYCAEYRRADSKLRSRQADNSVTGEVPRFAIEALGICLIALLALNLSKGAEGFGTALPLLGGLAIAAQRLLPMFQQVYHSLTSLTGSEQTLMDALALIEQPLPLVLTQPGTESVPMRDSIILKGVGFKYSGHGPWVLRDLNLRIARGGRVGFVGTTGSGKSTLLDILIGLLSPTEGQLTVDGQLITPANSQCWQQRIAHVPQAIYLSDTSVAENIAFGVPLEHIDMGRVRQAAEKAQMADTIDNWTLGYQTLVGERGVRLSGGQRQRIGIARALYKKADVLVFDEATSALDNKTERAVMCAIEALGRDQTILIVAHRITTLNQCDLIVELAQGRVSRIGTFESVFGETWLEGSDRPLAIRPYKTMVQGGRGSDERQNSGDPGRRIELS